MAFVIDVFVTSIGSLFERIEDEVHSQCATDVPADDTPGATWKSEGLVHRICFTAVRSPNFGGMAEAFVKTSKQDHVYFHERPDVKTAQWLLNLKRTDIER